jgi:hypothetical protein
MRKSISSPSMMTFCSAMSTRFWFGNRSES